MRSIYKTENINDEIKKEIAPFLKRLEECDYIEGIVLLGGLGLRDFSDKYSDIDITLFYTREIEEEKHLPFEFHYKVENRTYEFNIGELYYEEEKELNWDESKKEAYLRGRVIVDKNNRIQELIDKKTKYDSSNDRERLVFIMQQYYWRGQIHTIRSFHRGFPENAHILLNNCLEMLIEAFYIINHKYRPHLKWRFSNLLEMDIIPRDSIKNIREAFLIKDNSLKDIKRRIYLMDKVYETLKGIVAEKYPDFPENPYVYTYRNHYQLIPLTYSQRIKEKYIKEAPDKDAEQLEGKICFNLCSDEESLNKLL